MNDEFLHGFRREPPAEFAARLKASLDAKDGDPAWSTGLRATRGSRWAALAASVAVVALAFTFPSVRAGAQAFLDLFRVSGVVGVPIDEERLRALDFSELDVSRLLGDDLEVLVEGGAPQAFDSAAEASAAAGMDVMEPAWLPVGFEPERFEVGGEYAARGVMRTELLELAMAQLGISDLAIPPGVEGQPISVRVFPVVHAAYGDGSRRISLVQARSPEIAFPAGMDLAMLAEIGLRIVGFDRDEAHRVAGSVDWRSTLIVPVPVSAATFRSVNIAGRDALLIERRGETTLLWTVGERVFALRAELPASDAVTIAESLQ